jgi:hypothetical protein
MALSKIGQGTINSLSEAIPEAEICNLFYENVKNSLLRQYPWNFASKSLLLTETEKEVPAWNYTYIYPSNILHVRSVFDVNEPIIEIPNDFEIVTESSVKYICCNIYQAYAKCTYKVTDPTLFDPLFVEALSCKLALEISMSLTNNTSRTSEVMSKYKEALGNAMLARSIEGADPKDDTQKPKSQRRYINIRR